MALPKTGFHLSTWEQELEGELGNSVQSQNWTFPAHLLRLTF